ncbi:MAG: 1-acyl-sn-glycerol-3-phosphate acyltransferase [Pseudomonadales bacterium]|nr:1-acyl-sn-glycerol-3-phosphate acyltransferase [Pseudomonadales bacterium]
MRHILSATSLLVIIANLLFWSIVIVIFATLRIVPHERLQAVVVRALEWIYRRTVGVHTFWLTRVLGIRLHVHGTPPTNGNETMIITCNHVSWFDMFVVHAVITSRGPIIKFLVKRELLFVPIVGWICVAMGFPRLQRSGHSGGRMQDYRKVEDAAKEVGRFPGALFSFTEGTRFTPVKRDEQGSPYRHLLNPRSGGLRIMLATLKNVAVYDVTIAYPRFVSFWQYLGGAVRDIHIYVDRFESTEIQNANAWLAARWSAKDELIDAVLQEDHAP